MYFECASGCKKVIFALNTYMENLPWGIIRVA